jgi:hypothetical protein
VLFLGILSCSSSMIIHSAHQVIKKIKWRSSVRRFDQIWL